MQLRVVAKQDNTALTLEEFSKVLQSDFSDIFLGGRSVAVGVSGGSDSMALVKLLSLLAGQKDGLKIHALIVDHGLRLESSQEAGTVCSHLECLDHVNASILKWEGDKPVSGIQEKARRARYSLMSDYCEKHSIEHLFLAHHMDDQAETFLFRLAKGSGLDGLAGMKSQQQFNNILFCRPLLAFSKNRLIATCDYYGLEYVNDSSNESEIYARVRLRKSMHVLAREGMTVKRLAKTAMRLRRSRVALEVMACKVYQQTIIKENAGCIVFTYSKLVEWPDDIVLRVILKAVGVLRPDADYAPRMEKIESLFFDLIDKEPFRKRTLGGLVFERDDKVDHIIITKE